MVQQVATKLVAGLISMGELVSIISEKLNIELIKKSHHKYEWDQSWDFSFEHSLGVLNIYITEYTKDGSISSDKPVGGFEVTLYFTKPTSQSVSSITYDSTGRRVSAVLSGFAGNLGQRDWEAFYDQRDIPYDIHYYSDQRVKSLEEIYAEDLTSDEVAAEKKIRVAVIDSGVDYNHFFLAKFISRDFVQGEWVLRYGKDFNHNDDRPFDLASDSTPHHGTEVSGIILQNQDPWIELVPLRADSEKALIPAIHYAASVGSRIVHMSLQMGQQYMFENPEAWKRDLEKTILRYPQILFVVAAGNDFEDLDKTPRYPASIDAPNVLVVGAAEQNGELARFGDYPSARSSYGKNTVDVFSDGTQRMSCIPGGLFASDISGTSFAAPDLSRMAAFAFYHRPSWGPLDFISSLKKSYSPLPGLEEYGQFGGLMDEMVFQKSF